MEKIDESDKKYPTNISISEEKTIRTSKSEGNI